MPIYSERTFKESGVLAEPEYNQCVRILTNALADFRVDQIRKTLAFKPVEYDFYVAEALESFDRRNAPIYDREIDPSIGIIPFVYNAEFRAEYFPEFVRDYTCVRQDIIFDNPVEYEPHRGYCVVPTRNFRSIIMANYQIEHEVKERYLNTPLKKELTPEIDVFPKFLIPAIVELEPSKDMVVRLEILAVI